MCVPLISSPIPSPVRPNVSLLKHSPHKDRLTSASLRFLVSPYAGRPLAVSQRDSGSLYFVN